ncbi:MAG: HDOD domain-containing protein [Archangium sp.]|nr:HDOD domain-containing protein [Archangium sp.]
MSDHASVTAPRPRILFVDDDRGVLDGLQNILRKHRHQWDMVFVLGGEAALDELQRASFDVVVSDMRMPGIDGPAVLRKVKDAHPGAARIVLSGNADPEAVARALPVTHQFMSKPCDAAVLRDLIDRTCRLSQLLRGEAIRRVVGRLDTLPSAPAAYWELTQAVANPDTSIDDLARIVQRDPAMSVKVLQLVNSAYFGLARRMTSIQEAVAYLGVELLKSLALTVHVFERMEQKHLDLEGFSVSVMQERALLTARVAKRVVTDAKCADEAFTAGLVHDIGKMIMAVGLPEQFIESIRVARATGQPLHVVEKELVGASHAEVGAYLLGVWGLPFSIVEAVANHHEPQAIQQGSRAVLTALHVADVLVAAVCAGDDAPERGLDAVFLEQVGGLGKVARWVAIAREECQSGDRAQRQSEATRGAR